MRVKVHPHKSRVNAGVEAAVSVTPDQPGGHAFYVGTIGLRDVRFRIHAAGLARARTEQVRNVHAWVVGDVDFTDDHQGALPEGYLNGMRQVTYHYNVGRFVTMGDDPVDVTDLRFDRAVVSGRDFYVAILTT